MLVESENMHTIISLWRN